MELEASGGSELEIVRADNGTVFCCEEGELDNNGTSDENQVRRTVAKTWFLFTFLF